MNMSEQLLVPSIENRLTGFIEVSRRAKAEGDHAQGKDHPKNHHHIQGVRL